MDPLDGPLVRYKRWRLRAGADIDRVIDLVNSAVIPHYARLTADARLGLERQDDGSVLAIQRWPSTSRMTQAMSGPRFDQWWQDYQPILQEWDALLIFDDEWDATVLID